MNITSNENSFISYKIWLMSLTTICFGILGSYINLKLKKLKYDNNKRYE